MKRYGYGALAALILAAPSWAGSRNPFAGGACPADAETVIDAESHCFTSGGISIGEEGADGNKVACMQNKQVQRVCGQDGNLTRQHAFAQWYHKLEEFQARCAADGGTFAFQDPNFREPTTESYCIQAQPEINTNMFEEALCNYRSICPAVTAVCSYGCGSSAALPSDSLKSWN